MGSISIKMELKMTKLNDVLGGILCNLNEARLTADIDAKAMSNVYKNDQMLKHFSTPRAQIKEFELDLTCAVVGINLNEHYYLKEQKEEILGSLASTLSSSLIEKTIELLGINGASQTQLQHVNSLSDNLTGYLKDLLINHGVLEHLGNIEIASAHEDIKAFYHNFIYSKNTENIEINIIEIDANNEIEVTIAADLHEWLQSITSQLGKLNEAGLDVEVAADKLLQRPEHTLCTLRLKGDFRNYIWRETGYENGQIEAILVEE